MYTCQTRPSCQRESADYDRKPLGRISKRKTNVQENDHENGTSIQKSHAFHHISPGSPFAFKQSATLLARFTVHCCVRFSSYKMSPPPDSLTEKASGRERGRRQANVQHMVNAGYSTQVPRAQQSANVDNNTLQSVEVHEAGGITLREADRQADSNALRSTPRASGGSHPGSPPGDYQSGRREDTSSDQLRKAAKDCIPSPPSASRARRPRQNTSSPTPAKVKEVFDHGVMRTSERGSGHSIDGVIVRSMTPATSTPSTSNDQAEPANGGEGNNNGSARSSLGEEVIPWSPLK